jgi:hypothetical protein
MFSRHFFSSFFRRRVAQGLLRKSEKLVIYSPAAIVAAVADPDRKISPVAVSGTFLDLSSWIPFWGQRKIRMRWSNYDLNSIALEAASEVGAGLAYMSSGFLHQTHNSCHLTLPNTKDTRGSTSNKPIPIEGFIPKGTRLASRSGLQIYCFATLGDNEEAFSSKITPIIIGYNDRLQLHDERFPEKLPLEVRHVAGEIIRRLGTMDGFRFIDIYVEGAVYRIQGNSGELPWGCAAVTIGDPSSAVELLLRSAE